MDILKYFSKDWIQYWSYKLQFKVALAFPS